VVVPRAELARRLAGRQRADLRRAREARGRDAVLGHRPDIGRASGGGPPGAQGVGVAVALGRAWWWPRRETRWGDGVAVGDAVGVAVGVWEASGVADSFGSAVSVGVGVAFSRRSSSCWSAAAEERRAPVALDTESPKIASSDAVTTAAAAKNATRPVTIAILHWRAVSRRRRCSVRGGGRRAGQRRLELLGRRWGERVEVVVRRRLDRVEDRRALRRRRTRTALRPPPAS
jgi:hypothetical protein